MEVHNILKYTIAKDSRDNKVHPYIFSISLKRCSNINTYLIIPIVQIGLPFDLLHQ